MQSSSPKPPPISKFFSKNVTIKSKLSGRSLDICSQDGHGNTKNDLIIYNYYGGDNQIFKLIPERFQIIIKNQKSNLVLEVENETHKDGGKIVASALRTGEKQQRWMFQQKDSEKDEYFVYCCHSGKVMDVFEENGGNNTKVIQWEFHGRDNQVWIIQQV